MTRIDVAFAMGTAGDLLGRIVQAETIEAGIAALSEAELAVLVLADAHAESVGISRIPERTMQTIARAIDKRALQ